MFRGELHPPMVSEMCDPISEECELRAPVGRAQAPELSTDMFSYSDSELCFLIGVLSKRERDLVVLLVLILLWPSNLTNR